MSKITKLMNELNNLPNVGEQLEHIEKNYPTGSDKEVQNEMEDYLIEQDRRNRL